MEQFVNALTIGEKTINTDHLAALLEAEGAISL